MNLFFRIPNIAKWIMLFSLLQSWNAVCSQNRIDSLVHLLGANYQQEKIYLARDKAEYLSGESILLKGFVFAGYQQSDISSNLFVEILDKQKNLIAKNVSPVFNGITETGVRLPDTLGTGVYYLRAYTKWMLNFDEKFQYVQPIVIYNPRTNVSLTPDLKNWSFRAVPEGQKLLDGVPALLAIRFFGLERPTIISEIKLVDRTGNTVVASFSPLDQNIALCRFTPLFGHTYETEVIDTFGVTKRQVLPLVLQSGVVLNVLQNDTSIKGDSSSIFFVTAVDEKGGRMASSPDIVSSFWLTSGFVREIINAGQYFDDVNGNKKQALDGIMISEKWERFDWRKVLSGSFPKIIYQDDGYLAYSGTAFYKNKTLRGATINFFISYPDSAKQVLQVKTDDDGKFILRDLVFEGSANIKYYPLDKKVERKHFTIRLSPRLQGYPYRGPLPENNLVAIKKDERFEDRLLNGINTLKNDEVLNRRVKQLEEVVVWAKVKSATQVLNEKLSSGRFYNSRETIYDFVNKKHMTTAVTVLQFLSGKILCDAYNPCSYFVDEFPATRQDLSQVLISDVAMIKIQGKLNAHIILVYLKTGGEFAGANQSNSKNTISVVGYEKAENVRLNYSMPEYRNLISEDSRTVLLWSDLFVLDNRDQNNSVKFFNNDISKEIRISIVGIDKNGEPFSLEESY